MKIVDMNLVFHRMQSEFVGFADDLSAFYSATSHPHGEPGRVVIPPVSFLAHRGTAKFTAPDDEGFVQKPSGFEVSDKTDYGQVDLLTKPGVVALHLGMAIPLASGSVIELYEANPPLHQSAGEEALLAEDLCVPLIQAVERLGSRRLLLKVNRFGGVHLHVGGKLITADAGFQFTVGFSPLEVPLIEALQERQLQVFGLFDFRCLWLEVGNRFRSVFQKYTLMGSGHEPISPATGTIDNHGAGVLDDDEAGETLVFGTQAIGNP